ncbi:hypothetical protein T492DRAFT_164510 [Pavlovales sp. CCMP2436]|nr:hypothetical protein T492DRAFT_164510 [Pavlovales sp. CCMP2436]
MASQKVKRWFAAALFLMFSTLLLFAWTVLIAGRRRSPHLALGGLARAEPRSVVFAGESALTFDGVGEGGRLLARIGARCARGTSPMNRHAVLSLVQATPPYAVCTRPHNLVDDTIASSGRLADCDELSGLLPPPLSLVMALLGRKSPLFLDVGANIGACALRVASGGYRVIALEPVEGNFDALVAGAAANALPPGASLRVLNFAASPRAGLRKL